MTLAEDSAFTDWHARGTPALFGYPEILELQ
jgi:hypothetical protein